MIIDAEIHSIKTYFESGSLQILNMIRTLTFSAKNFRMLSVMSNPSYCWLVKTECTRL